MRKITVLTADEKAVTGTKKWDTCGGSALWIDEQGEVWMDSITDALLQDLRSRFGDPRVLNLPDRIVLSA
jgi:hypothetical protein